MSFLKSLFVNFLLLFKKPDVEGGCVLSLSEDFGSPSPVFLKNGVYLEPDPKSGNIELTRSDVITVACPGRGNYVMFDNQTRAYDVVEASCIREQTFRIQRWIGNFYDVKCKTQPWVTTEETSQSCYKGGKIYRVGYQVRSSFHRLYECCFDKNMAVTHYVRHYITPERIFAQKGFKRPQFMEGGNFGKTKMSSLYKLENQKKMLDEILGKNMSQVYLTKKQFLTRGHMAANADFTMHSQSRATFQYINASPQWMRGNGGDWAALEDSLRRRIHNLGSNVTVYTGTYGTMTLPDARGAMRGIYLDTDANNNPIVPVPLYFYKVAYDPSKQTASAFITINSSFYNQSLTDDLTFCNDICEGDKKFSWLKWRANDGTFSFCCEYDEFAESVNYLPINSVKGIFY